MASFVSLLVICLFLLNGCELALIPLQIAQMNEAQKTMERSQKQSELTMELMENPDLPEWNNQRAKITQAMGDKVFNKPFNEVFKATQVATSSMEVKVDSMEKESGYIGAHGRVLAPEVWNQLRKEGLVEYCRIKGYDPALLEKSKYGFRPGVVGVKDVEMTFSLVQQGPKQTKVKLRFKGVNYPGTLEACYKAVWPFVDKQIFMDKHLD